MDTPDHGGAGISVTSIIIILLTLGTVYVDLPPLKGARPQEPALAPSTTKHGEADARLWQDPFTAVTAHERRLKKAVENDVTDASRESPPPEPAQASQLAVEVTVASDSTVGWILDAQKCARLQDNSLVMGVAVFGGRYFESIESRRRTRYAVVSALASRGYYPKDAQRINYIRVPKATAGDQRSRILPYEVFRSRDRLTGERELFQPVFVLWLDDDWLGQRAVSGFFDVSRLVLAHECRSAVSGTGEDSGLESVPVLVNDLTHANTSAVKFPSEAENSKPRKLPMPKNLRLLGPAGSTSLGAMIAAKNESAAMHPPSVEIYSYSATVSDIRFLGKYLNNVDGPMQTESIQRHLRPHKFWRTIVTDEKLAGTMLDELDLRRIDPVKPSDRVALISEMDTFYAQQLPEAFGAAMCKKRFVLPEAQPVALLENPECKKWLAEHLIRMTYLRGMDGQLADGSNSLASSDSSVNGHGAEQDRPDSEPSSMTATGRHQFDYLLRLAQRLEKKNEKLKRKGESIKAIGILGSDVFDKLLVLRALRPLFPKVIFFTTDLDATLFSKDQLRWTRNLVVVSSFGLSLHPDLQKGVPPFRDSYQTSAFLSTLFAVEGMDRVLENSERGIHSSDIAKLFEPRIFEIGRGGAYELEPPGSTAHWKHDYARERITKSAIDNSPTRRTIRPKGKAAHVSLSMKAVMDGPSTTIYESLPSPMESAQEMWKIAIVVILFLCLIRTLTSTESVFATIGRNIRLGSWPASRWIQTVTFVLVATALVWILSIWLTEGFRGEPFYWTAGISIWPTEFIRLISIFIIVFLICLCWSRQRSNETRIAHHFRLGMTPGQVDGDEPSAVSKECGRRPLVAAWKVVERCVDRPWREIYTLGKDGAAPVDVDAAWRNYLIKRSFLWTAVRVLVAVLFFFAFGRVMVELFGRPHVPARGDISFFLDRVILLIMVPGFLVLNFLVADITRRSSEICTLLGKRRNLWPAETMKRVGSKGGAETSYLSEWVDVRFVARLTEDVSYFIYYPFLVLLILVVARLDFFDAWGTSWTLGLIFVASGLYAIGSAVVLERTARTVRRHCLRSLQLELVAAREQDKGGERSVSQIEWLIDDIRTTRQGAFAPVLKQPVVRTMIGIVGSVILLTMERIL